MANQIGEKKKMAKRFFDSRKYQDPWFRKLQPKYKLFWDYILSTCNHAGLWKVDIEMAEFSIRDSYKLEEIKKVFNGRIIEVNEEEWFIPKFVKFQQKVSDINELNPNNRCHKSIIDTLMIRGLLAPNKPLARVQGIGKGKGKGNIYRRPTLNQIIEYCKETNSHIDPEFFFNHYESTDWIKANGQKVKNWKATIKTWEKRNPKQTGREVRDL